MRSATLGRSTGADPTARRVGSVLRAPLALAFTLAAALVAGGPRAQADEGPAGEALVLSKETPVHDLLAELVRQRPGQFLWNPSDKLVRNGQVAAGTRIPGGAERLPAVRRLLAFYELALVPMGSRGQETWFVMDARQQGVILKLKPEPITLSEANLGTYEHEDGLFVTTTITATGLENLRDARQALSRIVTQQNIGSVTEVPDAKAFVVTDFAPNVVALYRLVRQLEASSQRGGSAVQSRRVRLEHATAADVASVLSSLLGPRPADPRPAQAQGGLGAAAEAFRVAADPRTNQLLLRGSAAELEEAEALLRSLDVPVATPAAAAAHVLPLRRARAERLANLLNGLVSSSPTLWSGDAGRGGRPVFLADERTNVLVVAATAQAFGAIEALVARLDAESEATPKEPPP